MSANKLSENFKSQLAKSLENEDFKDCSLKFFENTTPSEGFLALTYSAELSGTTKTNERKKLQVFIKCGKESNIFHGMIDSSEVYRREAYMYSTIFPAFSRLMIEKNVTFNLDYIPRCLSSTTIENIPVLVLENLKTQGYRVPDCLYPVSLEHMKLVYENYAKLHATSFALKDQKPREYEELTRDLIVTGEKFWIQDGHNTGYENHNKMLFEMLTEAGHGQVVQRWRKYLEKGSLNIFKEMKTVETVENIITHADCWNNNFMFKYELDDKTPTDVKLIDFQISHLHSPVADLSAYFYFICYSNTASHFDDLIEHYYKNFSTYLKDLGSDPEKIFPISTLKRHWKMLSIDPCLKAWHGTHSVLCDKEDIVRFEDMENTTDFLFKKDYKIKDMDLYLDRMQTIIKHYCDYQDKYRLS